MKLLLSLIALSCQFITVLAQKDSVSARYIKAQVENIESELDADFELTSDTTILDKDGTMTVHTSYYIDKGTGIVEKIIEKTLFGAVTTEITVYYAGRSTLLFSSKQWQGADLTIDFDYYFQSGSPVFLAKRTLGKGNPNSDEILKWCEQLLKESDNKKLAKINAEKTAPKKTVATTQTAPKTKKPLFSIFKKKKN
jgi:hypothetical protein